MSEEKPDPLAVIAATLEGDRWLSAEAGGVTAPRFTIYSMKPSAGAVVWCRR